MKELIKDLRTQFMDTKQMLPVQVCHEAADALVRLELESIAWSVTVDNLQAELEKAQTHIKHIGNDALRSENAELRAEIERLEAHLAELASEEHSSIVGLRTRLADQESDFDDLMLHNVELQEELAELKQQEPAAWINGFGGGPGNKGIYGWSDHPIGTKFYLSAGAQPAQEGCQLVPIEPTDAMLNAARDWSYSKYGKPIGNSAAVGCWEAMLSAAKGKS